MVSRESNRGSSAAVACKIANSSTESVSGTSAPPLNARTTSNNSEAAVFFEATG